MKAKHIITCLMWWIIIASCTSSKQVSQASEIQSLTYLDKYVIPHNYVFDSTLTGGLSGIDYDIRSGAYYLICDDRSDHNPARFYTATIRLKNNSIDTFFFTSVTFLANELGKYYPNSRQDPANTPDPEAMRFNPRTQTLTWSSEGERNKNIVADPSITEINLAGHFVAGYEIPDQMKMHENEEGPRQNGVFEGLAFSADGRKLYVSLEEPLYNDGQRASSDGKEVTSRIIVFDTRTRKPIQQFAYPLDAVAHAPVPADAFHVNGISDILWIAKSRLLVMERSFSVGRAASTIKIYLAELNDATDVSDLKAIDSSSKIKYVRKRLLLNTDDLGFYVDNLEGMTFGPRLQNGQRSLILVADNNFNPLEQSQVFLFSLN